MVLEWATGMAVFGGILGLFSNRLANWYETIRSRSMPAERYRIVGRSSQQIAAAGGSATDNMEEQRSAEQQLLALEAEAEHAVREYLPRKHAQVRVPLVARVPQMRGRFRPARIPQTRASHDVSDFQVVGPGGTVLRLEELSDALKFELMTKLGGS